MRIEDCKKCEKYWSCEQTGFLTAMTKEPSKKCGDYIEKKENKDIKQINQSQIKVFNSGIFIKSLVTNEGILENVRYEGTFDEFIKDINKGRIVKLNITEDNKIIYLNSIYIISFEC